MKNKRYQLPYLIALAVFLSVFATAIVLVFALGSKSAHADVSWAETEIEQTYSTGTELNVPERTVTVNGDSAKATSVVIFPDGNATTNTTVTLSESGIYKVVYTAMVNGYAYVDEVEFTVKDSLVSFSGTKSSVRFGKYESAKSAYGLMVRLAEGETMYINKVIDIADSSSKDTLFKGFATPDVVGMADFKALLFTVTDAVDPSVKVTVKIRQSADGDDYPVSYIQVAGNGQQMTGYEWWTELIHVNNEWGTQIEHTFSLTFRNGFTKKAPDDIQFDLRYDVSENAMYASHLLIADFDDSKFFTTLWHGFPSGKVRISVTADMYSAETAAFCLTELMGVEINHDSISQGSEDKDPPEITVDTGYNTMPQGAKGYGYPVPEATAHDIYSGKCEVETSVWYNYASTNAVLVDIVDGSFSPITIGDYAIVYEARDASGNTAKKVLWVNIGESVKKPEVTLIGTSQTTATVGDLILPSEYEAISYCGDVTVKVTAELNGEEIDATRGFRPEKTGRYTIKYTAVDYIGQQTSKTVEVDVSMSDVPVFVTEPTLPYAFVSGSKYTLPEYYAYDYRSGSAERKAASATVTDKNGARKVSAGGEFTPEVAANGDLVTVKFECDGAVKEVKVPCALAWIVEDNKPRLHLDNYLLGSGFTTVKTDDNITIVASEENGGWTFANAQLAESFNFVIGGITNASSFTGLVVTVTDSVDKSASFEFELLNSGTLASLNLNGEVSKLETGFNNISTFAIAYSGKQLKLKWDETYFQSEMAQSGVRINLGFFFTAGGATHPLTLWINPTGGQPQFIVTSGESWEQVGEGSTKFAVHFSDAKDCTYTKDAYGDALFADGLYFAFRLNSTNHQLELWLGTSEDATTFTMIKTWGGVIVYPEGNVTAIGIGRGYAPDGDRYVDIDMTIGTTLAGAMSAFDVDEGEGE